MRRRTLTTVAVAAALGSLVAAGPGAVAAPASSAGVAAAAALSNEGAYTPLTPARLLDTRNKTGVSTTTPIGGAKSIDVQVTGRGGVPSTNVSAVVINLTAVAPTKRGYLTVYPSTASKPVASSINFNAGWTGANLVTLPLGAGGKMRIFNAAGNTHVVADVVGYYHTAASTADPATTNVGSFESITPTRVVDTRTDDWDRIPLGPQEFLWTSLDFEDSGFNARVQAFAVNVTVVGPTRQGHVTVFDGNSSDSIPPTSSLNFAAGKTVPNMSIVKVGRTGAGLPRFGVANASLGAVHIVADLVGVYFAGEEGDSGWRFKPLTSPQRFVDSRIGQGLATNLGSNVEREVVVPSGIAGANTMAVVTNTTAAQPTTTTVLTLWANSGQARPGVSNLNPYAGQVVSNMTITEVWTDNDFRIHNRVGTTPVVIDAAGTFELFPPAAPMAGTALSKGAKAGHDSSLRTPDVASGGVQGF